MTRGSWWYRQQISEQSSLTEFGFRDPLGRIGRRASDPQGASASDSSEEIDMEFNEKNAQTVGQRDVDGYWKPEKKGDQLIGRLIESFEGKFGTVYVLHDEDSDTKIGTPSHQVLEGAMSEVPEGAVTRVTYNGEVENEEKSRKYRDYTVDYIES